MDNLSQTMLNALVNANANGQKVNLDEILKEVLREEIEKGVNEIIGHELTAFLGYEKSTQGASKELGNSRNGYYERMLNTSYGIIKVDVPRDRKSEFETGLFDRRKRSTQNIGQTALVKKKWTQAERLLVMIEVIYICPYKNQCTYLLLIALSSLQNCL